jgi:VIT1/CCC1 family predicted Fe2+/Mn2+ transporter
MRDEQLLNQAIIPAEFFGATETRRQAEVNVPITATHGAHIHVTVDVEEDRDEDTENSSLLHFGRGGSSGPIDRRAFSRDGKSTKNDAGVQKKYGADSNRVRDDYERGDVSTSRVEHRKRAPEHNPAFSEYVKSIIFGGLDGIITTFAVVAAAAGAEESWKVVLIFGFANLAADAWSMGSGEFISAMAELDRARAERKREQWEMEHDRSGEIAEMIAVYEEKGFSRQDAMELVRIISKDDKTFVDTMMVEELGILNDGTESWKDSFKQGVFMFFSFIFFGLFPLAAYFGGRGKGLDWVFGLACGITGIGLMILGGAKGHLVSQSVPFTAVKMLGTGVVSGGLSYGLGVLVSYAVTGDPNAAS